MEFACSGLVKTLLICHHDAVLDRIGLARWLGSFSELVGVVEVREPKQRLWRRVPREVSPAGPLRILGVLAFRAYEGVAGAPGGRAGEGGAVKRPGAAYPPR